MQKLSSNTQKTLIFTLVLFASVTILFSSTHKAEAYTVGAFVTTWKTDNPGSSNSTSITIPTTGGGYNYDVDWDNDGTFDEIGITGDVTHNFGVAGTYTIQIRGTFPKIYFNNAGDIQKILSVDQWGTIAWTSMERAFYGCFYLNINASDTPDLSNVTDMSFMFASTGHMNQSLNSWDVSNITNMFGMFYNASTFNQPLNSWDVSNVTDMHNMFFGALSFNQDISSWDTSSVTDLNGIFWGASSFNQPLNSWDVSHAVDMKDVFLNATSFNQPLNSWDTSSATSMVEMFHNASAFDQDISSWDVSGVIYMSVMFENATSFNQPLNSWDVSNVVDIGSMFNGAISFNQPLNSWDVSNATMAYVFAGATSFNQDISSWDVSNVTDMTNMFTGVTLSTVNYDALLTTWSALPLQLNVPLDGGNSTYCSAVDQRASIISTYNWTITDGGIAPGICPPKVHHGGVSGGSSASAINNFLLQNNTTPPTDCLPYYQFSPTTGRPCTTTTVLTDCLAGYLFSPNTGRPCNTTTNRNTPTTPTNPTSCTIINKLKLWSRGAEVKCLQTILKIQPDGLFGHGTKTAVINFQTAHNLTLDGIVGKMTRGALGF